MGTEKRERQKTNREARLAAEQAAEARRRRLRFIRNAVILTIVIIVVGLVMAGCSNSSDGKAGGPATTEAPATPATGYGTGPCPPAEGASKPVVTFEAAPKRCIDPAKTYTAVVDTTEGKFSLELDTERTPLTTNNFVTLARYGYYDGTSFFRTEAQSGIIQGGSPHTQSNTDEGPGYTIPDEGLPFTSADYAPGAIAMARTAEPDSASGQFFLLANEGGAYLGDKGQLGSSAGTYAVFGKVTDGLDVLEKIAALDSGSSAPSKPVSIRKVTIRES